MQKIVQQIATESLARVYLIYGKEVAKQQQVYQALKERANKEGLPDWNWSVFHGTKDLFMGRVYEELAIVPLGGGIKVVVIRNMQEIPAAEMESLVTWIQEQEQTNCLALFSDQIDKRLKYVKVLKKFAHEIKCDPLQGDALLRYVSDYCLSHGKKFKQAACVEFVNRVGSELTFIHSELTKLLTFVEEREEITLGDVQSITSFVPAQAEKNAVFSLAEYIANGERRRALETLNTLIDSGETPFRILPLIERQLRLLLAAKTSTSSWEDTAEQMGERSAYPVRKMQQVAKKHNLEQLLAGFEAVVHADREMKLGVPGDKVLEELVVRLTS